MTMLEEKRKINIAHDRLMAHVFFGGKVPDVDEEAERNTPTPGIDMPVNSLEVDWLSRRQ